MISEKLEKIGNPLTHNLAIKSSMSGLHKKIRLSMDRLSGVVKFARKTRI